MVVIRLARGGTKNSPFYHVVAADRRAPRDGRFLERLGYFNPMARGQETSLELNKERIEHWISKGAIPSERVAHLVKTFKKLEGKPAKAAPTKAEMKQAQQEASMVATKKQVEIAKKAEAEEKAKGAAEEAAKAAEEAKAAKAEAAAAPKEEAAPESKETPKAEEAPKSKETPKTEEAPKEAAPEAKETPKETAAPEAKVEKTEPKAEEPTEAKKDDKGDSDKD